MKKYFALLLALIALLISPALAGERTDLFFTNDLEQEIVSIRVKYETPSGDPRYNSSRVNLQPGAKSWRTGVQGTTRPEMIIIDLATTAYVFDDLSKLDPESEMHLEVKWFVGEPSLWRSNGKEGGEKETLARVSGVERSYLTDANRPHAVDRDSLTGITTAEELGELLAASVDDSRMVLKEIEVEAGALVDEDNEEEICPEAAAEWSEANGREARWTGRWSTQWLPDQESTCTCEAEMPAAGLEETVFQEDDGWGEAVLFPVAWKKWTGVARVSPMDGDDESLGMNLRFRIPAGNGEEMSETLLEDLRVDGFRPLRFSMRTWNGETEESGEVEIAFGEDDGDKFDHFDALMAPLLEAYDDHIMAEASSVWVKEETFDALKAGEDPEPAQGVMALFSRGTFEAVFVPDARMFIP